MISRDLLVHSATVYTAQRTDADRNTQWDTGLALSRVRITASRSRTLSGKGFILQDKALMFFDCAQSQPAGFVPKEGMCIEQDSRRYTIREVTHAYGSDNRIEFYKAALV